MIYSDKLGRTIKKLEDGTIIRISNCKKEYTELDIFKAETKIEIEYLKSLLEVRGVFNDF